MNKLIAITLAGFAALATPGLSSADTRVYVGIGLPVAPVVVESRHHHYGYGAPVYYREPVIYYAPAWHRGRGHGHYDEHRHDRYCRHEERWEDRRDDRRWRGQDDDRGLWRGDDHRRHRGRRD